MLYFETFILKPAKQTFYFEGTSLYNRNKTYFISREYFSSNGYTRGVKNQ